MQPISTDNQLPDADIYVLWWHPKAETWHIGWYWTNDRTNTGGLFKGYGAWYVKDGPTWWTPVPPNPVE